MQILIFTVFLLLSNRFAVCRFKSFSSHFTELSGNPNTAPSNTSESVTKITPYEPVNNLTKVNLECAEDTVILGGSNEVFCAILHANIPRYSEVKVTNARQEAYTAVNFYSYTSPVFPSTIFSNFIHLKELIMNRGDITEFPAQSFRKAYSLNVLSLAHNRIKEIPDRIFTGAVDLRELDLSNNYLAELRNDSFASLSSLEILKLNYNNLSVISEFTFVPLPNLKRLEIYYSSLITIHPLAFAQNHQLTSLDIEGNKLTELELVIGSNILEKFIGSDNILRHFSIKLKQNEVQTITTSASLTIHLSSNQIEKFYCDYRLNLVRLDIDQNRLKDVTDVTSLTTLERLNLDSNEIKFIGDGAFSKLQNLIELKLKANELRIDEHSAPFGGLESLIKLDISFCELDQIYPNWFKGLENLQELDLSGNKLTFFDTEELFNTLENLKKLNIDLNLFRCDVLEDIFSMMNRYNVQPNHDPKWALMFYLPLHKNMVQGIQCIPDNIAHDWPEPQDWVYTKVRQNISFTNNQTIAEVDSRVDNFVHEKVDSQINNDLKSTKNSTVLLEAKPVEMKANQSLANLPPKLIIEDVQTQPNFNEPHSKKLLQPIHVRYSVMKLVLFMGAVFALLVFIVYLVKFAVKKVRRTPTPAEAPYNQFDDTNC